MYDYCPVLLLLFPFFGVLFLLWLSSTQTSFNLWWARKRPYSTDIEDSFIGRNVWIVGASSGIGRSIALRLGKCGGCTLILSGRRKELLEKVATEAVKDYSVQSYVVPLDITDFASFDGCIKHAKKNCSIFARIDTVILACGRSQRAEWMSVKPEVDEECFRVNALGHVQFIRRFLSLNKENIADAKRGRPPMQIVLVSSIAGVIPAILSPSYTAAKHALMGYFRSLALEYSHKGLRVTLACPALTFAPNNPLTAFTESLDQQANEIVSSATEAHMSPDDAAELILLAAANGLNEVWISKNPRILWLAYLSLLSPELTYWYINKFIGVEKMKALRTGKNE